jgi:NAD(P)-dependent dehydrogenase (short-subunit alcohol dehydrogenase family)
MFELTGKTAVVTGASQGLGLGFARALALQGVRLALVHRADHDPAEAVQAVQDAGAEALGIAADVTDAAAVEALRDSVLSRLGAVDILINNVGGFPTAPRPLVEMSDDDWHRSIDLNLTSAFLCCRAFVPEMQRRRYGRVVNISASLSAATGIPTNSNYSAAKAGLISMTKALAREIARDGVTANVVAPGLIQTPMHDDGAALGWWSDEDEIAGIASGRPGTVDDVSGAVVFFCSDEAQWITGQTLHVNGGSFMG